MKKLLSVIFCALMAQGVYAADDGGFKKDAAPPPPHKIDDGYRGTEDGRIMTVRQARKCTMGQPSHYAAILSSSTVTTATAFAIKPTPSQ